MCLLSTMQFHQHYFVRVFGSQSCPTSAQAHPLELNDHDHIFWAGDLNYRISMPDLDAVYAKIEARGSDEANDSTD